MKRLPFTIAFCLFASPVLAADCNLFSDLHSDGFLAPGAYRISGPKPLAFMAGGDTRPGCPEAGASCRLTEGALPPDSVIVITGALADYFCASILGAAPDHALVSGFLPRARLEQIPTSPPADWTGTWRFGSEQEITINRAPDGLIDIAGDASYGASDPDRVANGGVNEGSISAALRPQEGYAAFTEDYDENTLPYDAASDFCSVRLWRLDSYLVVRDNNRCGGMNVTFTGLYQRAN